jgi:hypothetical protein
MEQKGLLDNMIKTQGTQWVSQLMDVDPALLSILKGTASVESKVAALASQTEIGRSILGNTDESTEEDAVTPAIIKCPHCGEVHYREL